MNDSIYRIKHLDSANCGVVSIKPDALLTKATSLMMLNGFSQLPVMPSKHQVKGIISWKTIGSKQQFDDRSNLVEDYMSKVRTIPSDTNFLDAVKIILKEDFVLVQNDKGLITGIVTLWDIGAQFLTHSEPFIELEQIEKCLRQFIDRAFNPDELKEIRSEWDPNRRIVRSSDLTFGEYIVLFRDERNWLRLNLGVDKDEFLGMLTAVNVIRNKVMHFRIEKLEQQDLKTLSNLSQFLRMTRKLTANRTAHPEKKLSKNANSTDLEISFSEQR